jgi:hypothetical protein
VFQDKFWVVGGKSQYHPIYTLAAQNTENDVWYTEDGGTIRNDHYSLTKISKNNLQNLNFSSPFFLLFIDS